MTAGGGNRPPWAGGTRIEGLGAPSAAGANGAGPDAAGHVERDEPPLVALDIEVNPPVVAPGSSARIRIELRPDATQQAHWNNEAADTQLWLEPPAGWQIAQPLHTIPNPVDGVSSEPRVLDIELRAPDGVEGASMLRGYALYFVCEDVTGVCMFRRQDFEARIEAREP